jgi:hypothetical protein
MRSFNRASKRFGRRPRVAEAKDKLEAFANPQGEGVLIFVRRSDDCGPRYAWVWLGGSVVYPVDEDSAKITPSLPQLTSAAPEHQRRIGFKGADFGAVVRKMGLSERRVLVPLRVRVPGTLRKGFAFQTTTNVA